MTVGELKEELKQYVDDVDVFMEDGSHVLSIQGMNDPSQTRIALCSTLPKTKYRPLGTVDKESP